MKVTPEEERIERDYKLGYHQGWWGLEDEDRNLAYREGYAEGQNDRRLVESRKEAICR